MGTLTAQEVLHLSEPGKYADGDGLYLYIRKNGNKSWEYRYQLHGKRRQMGLGGYNKKTNTLADARSKVIEKRLLIQQGIDPIEHQKEQDRKQQAANEQVRTENIAQTNAKPTFKFCAERYIKKKSPEWKNDKHQQQWYNTLETYVYPFIGKMPIDDVQIEDIQKVLDPIWTEITETATRVRQRMEAVFSAAIALRERTQPNPAVWKGLLENFYPNPEKVKRNKHLEAGTDGHFAAMPYEELPEFMAELIKLDGIAPLAVRFLILTVPRTTELRLALPDEINIEKKIWTVPAGRMKASIEHRIALSDAAIETFQQTPRVKGNDYIFAGWKKGRPLSENGLLSVLRTRMDIPDYTIHGFRSTFRDYIGEETSFPHRVAEFAIAHQLTDDAEKAYARGDMLKKRFAMMNAWANYCDSKIKKSNIVYFSKQA